MNKVKKVPQVILRQLLPGKTGSVMDLLDRAKKLGYLPKGIDAQLALVIKNKSKKKRVLELRQDIKKGGFYIEELP